MEQSPHQVIEPGLLDHVRQVYGLKITDDPTYMGGSNTTNLKIKEGNDTYVIRFYRNGIAQGRLAAIQTARKALSSAGVPAARVIPTLAGDTWTIHDDRHIEVEAYVPRDGTMITWERLEVGLPTLGRVHNIFSKLAIDDKYKQPVIANHLASNKMNTVVEQAAEQMGGWPPTEAISRFVFLAKSLAKRLRALEPTYMDAIPHQLVHGDFWDDNVFFRNEKVVLVSDLDFMGERPRIDDLALTLYYTNSTFSDDQSSKKRIRQLKVLVDAYDSGLDEPLTTNERATLPLALVRTTLFIMNYYVYQTSEEAGNSLAETLPDLEWAVKVLDNLQEWQSIFTNSR